MSEDAPTLAPGDPFLGRQLGKFLLEQKLGQGGMGAVYRALDTKLDRRVALKVLPPALAAQDEYKVRFLREARRAGRLDHPNVVQVYEVDEVDGVHYIAMQLLSGGSLQDLLKRKGTLPPPEAARILREAARGLARAHREGIIHRDVKPANILLGAEGEVRLSDFGLVKDLSPASGDAPLTQSGAILGTPQYMAPEQCEGLLDIDHRADLYALGLVLYQALSGTLPAQGSTPLQIIHHRLRNDPPPLGQVAPHVPAPLVEVVDALLVRDRTKRLASADELVGLLEAVITAEAVTVQPPPRVVSGARAAIGPGFEPVPEGVKPTSVRKVIQARPVSGAEPPAPAPPSGPARPAVARPPQPQKRGWSCWKIGCCVGVACALLLGGGIAGVAVMIGVTQNDKLGGAPAAVFWPGRPVVIEGHPRVSELRTRVVSLSQKVARLDVALEPIAIGDGHSIAETISLDLAIELVVPRVEVRPWDFAVLPDPLRTGDIRRDYDGTLVITYPFLDQEGEQGTLVLRFLNQ